MTFQHTAARRRLHIFWGAFLLILSFNTQPPEGGCPSPHPPSICYAWFQHTAARRRLQKKGK